MKKKLLGLCICLICLLGCASKKETAIALSDGKVLNIQNNVITLSISNTIPRSNTVSNSKDEIILKFKVDDNTLFLKNGTITSSDALETGSHIIFTEEENTLLLIEIVDTNS